jgi:hypothetical protein
MKSMPIFLVLTLIMPASSIEAATFYINDTTRSTGNNGSRPDPWHRVDSVNNHVFYPGDRILLARGTVDTAGPGDTFMPACEKAHKPYKRIYGFVCPQGSGSSAAPIIIDAYGSGFRPVISARGLRRTAAVLLYNQDHWTIQHIEVRNCPAGYVARGCSVSHNFAVPDVQARHRFLDWRWGIFAYFDDNTMHRNLTVRQCTVDSVLGGDCNLYFPYGPIASANCPWWAQQYACCKGRVGEDTVDRVVSNLVTGGIMVRTDGYTCRPEFCPPGSAIRPDGATSVDSVLLDSNNIHDIFGEAIAVGNDSVEADKSLHRVTGRLDSNVSITGDTIQRTAGNGIHLFCGTDGATVSGNIIDSAGCGADNATIASGSRRNLAVVGIELDLQKNTVVQYNAISNITDWDTVNAAGVRLRASDAEAIDFDANWGFFSSGRVYVQYNYSCNNGQGFYNSCMGGDSIADTAAVVRYNISQNDGTGYYLQTDRKRQPLVINDSRGGCLFYNNVFYNDTGIDLWTPAAPQPRDIFLNNIFITQSPRRRNAAKKGWFEWNIRPNTALGFSHNCWYDLADSSCNTSAYRPWPVQDDESWSRDGFAIPGDPRLQNPGRAVEGFLVKGMETDEMTSARACYRLNALSPCLGAGVTITGSVRDFMGTPAGKFPVPLNIGVDQVGGAH